MNIRHSFIGAVAALCALVASGAQAYVVDYDGTNVNMGTVGIGQTGTITNNASGAYFPPYYLLGTNDFGFLPAYSKITFTYTFTGLVGGILQSYGSYGYTDGGVEYNGNAFAESTGTDSLTTSSGYIDGNASTPLVLASANLTTTTGTTSIINNSAGLAQFQSLFTGLLGSAGGILSITYNVSAVPLPAALPMFGAMVAALFGFGQYRKRKGFAAA